MQAQLKVPAVAAALFFSLPVLAVGTGDSTGSFTIVRAQVEQSLPDKVLESEFGDLSAEAQWQTVYAKARAGFGNSGAYAAVPQPGYEAFAETWWADGFTITGGVGQGELHLAIRVSGTSEGKGVAHYGLFSSLQPFDQGALRSWLDCCMPEAPQSSTVVVPITEDAFPSAGATVLQAEISFTYDKPIYLASYFGVESFDVGVADFYGSAHFGLTAPAGASIAAASGTAYLSAAAVPEPATAALWLLGLAGLAGLRGIRRGPHAVASRQPACQACACRPARALR